MVLKELYLATLIYRKCLAHFDYRNFVRDSVNAKFVVCRTKGTGGLSVADCPTDKIKLYPIV